MKKVTARENFVAIKNIVAATENADELVAFLDKKIAEIDATMSSFLLSQQ